jgi:GntP family gluconate:H+ symporter
LFLCVGLVIFLITIVRLHAFMSLIFAAIAAGMLAGPHLKIPAGANRYVQTVEMTTAEFGTTAGKIGIIIAMASVIALCLRESGAADKVVRRFVAVIGEKRAGFALFLASYFLSIPIFFDTYFMLLLPIAVALALRLKKDYLLLLMGICASSAVTHVLIVPHPGPLLLGDELHLNVGTTIIAGLIVGIVPAFCAWGASLLINRAMPVPFRPTQGATLEEMEKALLVPESSLPGLLPSVLPVIVPIVLISAASIVAAMPKGVCPASLQTLIEFAGNRNVALILGAVIAMAVLAVHKGYSVAKICTLISAPLETGGTIILITSAGGAFGLMLRNIGVGDAVKAAADGRGLNLILLAWLVSSVLRIAQGSATVAMLATATMVFPMIYPNGVDSPSILPYHPVYIFLAIGFGAIICSWMNDSGFWVVSKLSGLTEKETLKSWTVITTVIAISGLCVTFIISKILPLAPN